MRFFNRSWEMFSGLLQLLGNVYMSELCELYYLHPSGSVEDLVIQGLNFNTVRLAHSCASTIVGSSKWLDPRGGDWRARAMGQGPAEGLGGNPFYFPPVVARQTP